MSRAVLDVTGQVYGVRARPRRAWARLQEVFLGAEQRAREKEQRIGKSKLQGLLIENVRVPLMLQQRPSVLVKKNKKTYYLRAQLD